MQKKVRINRYELSRLNFYSSIHQIGLLMRTQIKSTIHKIPKPPVHKQITAKMIPTTLPLANDFKRRSKLP